MDSITRILAAADSPINNNREKLLNDSLRETYPHLASIADGGFLPMIITLTPSEAKEIERILSVAVKRKSRKPDNERKQR